MKTNKYLIFLGKNPHLTMCNNRTLLSELLAK